MKIIRMGELPDISEVRCGILIEATPQELRKVANLLYRDVTVAEAKHRYKAKLCRGEGSPVVVEEKSCETHDEAYCFIADAGAHYAPKDYKPQWEVKNDATGRVSVVYFGSAELYGIVEDMEVEE